MAKAADVPQGNVETLHAPHTTPNQPPSPKTDGSARILKKARGEGLTITIDFKDHIELLEMIKDAAKADDREPSKWLRRRIRQLNESGQLFQDGEGFDPEDNGSLES